MPDDNSIPRECADHFQLIATSLATIDTKTEAIGDKVEAMSLVLLGNGSPEKSLVARVCKIENEQGEAESTRNVWTERGWQILLLIIAGIIGAACTGCAGGGLAPSATVAPVNKGTIENQTIDQTQKTIADHALDAERAKVQVQQKAMEMKSGAANKLYGLALLIVFAVAPSFLPPRYQFVGYVAAGAAFMLAVAMDSGLF